jgi:hypothetical protein
VNTLSLVISSVAAANQVRRKTSTLFLAGLFAGALNAQLLTLPDSCNLGESPIQAHADGSLVWWGTTPGGRHFQVRYNASHFLSAGVIGPIGITHLRFRGEDTEHNVGGQTFFGVMASVYATTLAAAPLAPVFAANTAPAAPDFTILLGAVFIPALIVAPSMGTAPNNYIIDLDFTMGPPLMPFDPTGVFFGPAVNLLVDVSWMGHAPAGDPQGSTMIATQDTSGPVAVIAGSGVYAAGPGMPAGVVTAFPPVMQVEFFGPGGYGAPIPARNERIGAACGGTPSAFYQEFAHDQYFDLKDPGEVDGLMGLTLTPNVYPGPAFYIVSGGAAPLNMFGIPGVPLSIADDATVPFALPPGITFDYPGGPPGGTPLLHPATNGYVWLDPAVMEVVSDWSPTVAEFLGATPAHLARVAPFWHDFSCGKNAVPPFGFAGSGLYAINDPVAMETVVTWFMVGRYNSVAEVFQESHTMQCSFNWITGVIQFRYGPMDPIWGDTFGGTTSGITGFTRGNIGGFPSVDPGSRDLSIERGPFAPFSTMVEMVGFATPNMTLAAASMPVPAGPTYGGRMFPGQAITWTASGVPAGSIVGALLVDVAATRPGLVLPGFFAPGCIWSLGPTAMILDVTVFPPPVAVGVAPIVVPPGYIPGLLGFEIAAQYAATDFVAPPVLSNAILHTVGLR